MTKTFEPLKSFFSEVGGISIFAGRFFREGFLPPYEFNELLRQSFEIGYRTLTLVGVTGFIMGLVITIQSHPSMEAFGTESWLPSVVSVSLVREIVPVITALICAGKIGSGIGAELGSMNVTEQIDAMEVSGTNPFKYLIVTRVIATTLMLPILVILADTISLYGAFIGVNMKQVISFNLYTNQIFEKLSFSDVLPSIIKSFFFGFGIAVIGCYKGYYTRNGTEGVGRAANSSVVVSTFVVFIIDLLAAQIADILHFT
ncbi:MAG: ABC transporter permease [Bacteroidetes bacterium]|nr:ABC transporter permease [Bacteroidota bacterium]